MTKRFLLVGLGRIAEVHLEALERFPTVEVVAGVDPDASRRAQFRGSALPVYREVQAGLAGHAVDTVVVASPTTTHLEVCEAVLGHRTDVELLVEKPLATRLADVRRLLDGAHSTGRRLRVMFHYAYAAEVVWAAERLSALVNRFGPVVDAKAAFYDPYVALPAERTAAYVSSWVDSGINALTVLDRLLGVEAVTTLRQIPATFSTYEASVELTSQRRPRGVIVTGWDVTDAAKTTLLQFTSGAALLLDHTAVSARVTDMGEVVDSFAGAGGVPRLVGHYVGLYEAFLSGAEPGPTPDHDLRLHRLLLAPLEG